MQKTVSVDAGGGCHCEGSPSVQLTHDQTKEIYHRIGAWLKEACDRCQKPLNQSYSYRNRQGTFCSSLCRGDALEAATWLCRNCGAGLNGRRSQTRTCSDRCRQAVRRAEKSRTGRETVTTTPGFGPWKGLRATQIGDLARYGARGSGDCGRGSSPCAKGGDHSQA